MAFLHISIAFPDKWGLSLIKEIIIHPDPVPTSKILELSGSNILRASSTINLFQVLVLKHFCLYKTCISKTLLFLICMLLVLFLISF